MGCKILKFEVEMTVCGHTRILVRICVICGFILGFMSV